MADTTNGAPAAKGQGLVTALAWLYVGIPLVWGITQTVIKSAALFR
jgi:hypothetical protein